MDVLASSGLRTTVLYVRAPEKSLSRPEHVSTKSIFLVSSESECETAEAWCRDNKIDFFDLIPIFNGKNKDFFIKNMFLSEEDILRSHLERRTVFAHMVVNTEFFGHMTVMPDGKVYADPTEQSIGNIEDSVYDLITSELEHNTAWRKTRNMLEKCHTCLYRYLCPSPNAYEKIMNIDCICTNKIKKKEGETM